MRKIISRILFWLMIAVLVAGAGLIAHEAVSLYNSPYTSFPWHTAFIFPGLYVYAALIVLFILHAVIKPGK